MHVPFLSKWHIGHNDPWLGDFHGMETMLVEGNARVSVQHAAVRKELG
ncbi:MAG: hypothetical protein WAT74_09885 [Flavobacteriales bacterium]